MFLEGKGRQPLPAFIHITTEALAGQAHIRGRAVVIPAPAAALP